MRVAVPDNDLFSEEDLESLDVRPGEVLIRFRGLRQPIVFRPDAEGLPWSPETLEAAWRHFATRAGVSPDDDDAFADFVEAVEELADEALVGREDDAEE